MGLLGNILCALCILHGSNAATIRKGPAFATPIYSDAYLPAAMQVIFNMVDQLKRLDAEEAEQNLLSTSATSPHPPGQKQPIPTTPSSSVETTEAVETTTVSDEEKYYIPPERYQEEALIISKPAEGVDSEKIAPGEVTPEVNHEESEIVYGVPETSFELPETNDEIPEEESLQVDHPQSETPSEISSDCSTALKSGSTVDSVVDEIYSIVKTSSNTENGSSADPATVIRNECIEGKNSHVNLPADADDDEGESTENKERSDESKDDKRYTQIGERVDQVPRPSLVAMLRASNATKSPSLRDLGELYDALSRDARRQGFSKFAGYSDAVIKFLAESAGGGAGLQLKQLLEKSVKQKELTRYDAMSRTNEIIAVLNDDGSRLSTDLRRLLPLRFIL